MKTVIFDFDITQLLNNRLFNPELANKVSHTILPARFYYNLKKISSNYKRN